MESFFSDKTYRGSCLNRKSGVAVVGLGWSAWGSIQPSSFPFPWTVSRTPEVQEKLWSAPHSTNTPASFIFQGFSWSLSLHLLLFLWFCSVQLGSQRSALAKEAVQVALLKKNRLGTEGKEASLVFFSWSWHWFMVLPKARHGTHMPPFLCYEKTPGGLL